MRPLGRFLRLERVRRDSEHELPAAPSRFSISSSVLPCAITPAGRPVAMVAAMSASIVLPLPATGAV